MKTKLTLLLTALAIAGTASVAMAGPDLQEFALRKQIADNARTAARAADSGAVTYVANPSGKGGVVAKRDDATSIALFKSPKAKACDDAACCAKAKEHKH